MESVIGKNRRRLRGDPTQTLDDPPSSSHPKHDPRWGSLPPSTSPYSVQEHKDVSDFENDPEGRTRVDFSIGALSGSPWLGLVVRGKGPQTGLFGPGSPEESRGGKVGSGGTRGHRRRRRVKWRNSNVTGPRVPVRVRGETPYE